MNNGRLAEQVDTRDVIEDLDGAVAGPRRRGHVLVLSLLLVVGCVVAWSAATSTAFQGPFATPAPSSTPQVRYTADALPVRVDPAAGPFPFVLSGGGCSIPGVTSTTTQVVFVGGQSVTLTRPANATLPTCPPAPRPPFER